MEEQIQSLTVKKNKAEKRVEVAEKRLYEIEGISTKKDSRLIDLEL
jgi:hypothetical protein